VSESPALSVVKTVVLGVLALLVGLTFWQGVRREDRAEELRQDVGQLRNDLQMLAGRIREGGVAVAPAATASAASETPPAWVTGRARELWGRTPNFLTVDPDAVRYPALSTPGINPNGRLTTWFQNAVSGLNPITKQDGLLTIRIKERCLDNVAGRHVKNPSLYSPNLALRVEHDPEFTEYVVWLRPGVRWQTPEVDLERYAHLKGAHEVTAKDFQFTLDLILNKEVDGGSLRSYYSECSGIEVVDDHCFVMRWRKKQYNSLEYTLGSFYPLPEFVFRYDEKGRRYTDAEVGGAFNDHWFYRDNHFIGCGPYALVSYDDNSHCLLRRFDEHWDRKNVPPIRELYMEVFSDRGLQIQKLMAGEHDYGGLLAKDWDRLRNDPSTPLFQGKLEENWIPSTQYGFIAWKNTHEFFKDVRVRRAMTMACDRPRILETLSLGRGVNSTGPHYVHSPNCPKDLKPLPFDLAAARALLAEAGWKNRAGDGVLVKEFDGTVKPFQFKAMIPSIPEWKSIWEIFKEDLAKIGVVVDLDMLEWKQFSERLDSRTFEATCLYWDTSGWDDDLYQIWHSSQVEEIPSSNFIEFEDAEVDRLIEQARVTFDPAERVKVQQAAHRRIAELQPYTFMNTVETPVLSYKDRVGNVKAGLVYRIRPFGRTFPMTVLAR
jgi:ABC-type transport system substrate-binding protein